MTYTRSLAVRVHTQSVAWLCSFAATRTPAPGHLRCNVVMRLLSFSFVLFLSRFVCVLIGFLNNTFPVRHTSAHWPPTLSHSPRRPRTSLSHRAVSLSSLFWCVSFYLTKPSSFLHALYTHSEHSCARSSSTSLRVLSCRRQMRLLARSVRSLHTHFTLILFRLCFDCLQIPVSIDPRDLLRLSSRACPHSQLRT